LEIRAGLHTGEYEMIGQEIAGDAIHIAARITSQAGANEVWSSSTVKDLVAGSGLVFQDQGTFRLNGVVGDWRLFRLTNC
jgi:class 3 adenylate cyclase